MTLDRNLEAIETAAPGAARAIRSAAGDAELELHAAKTGAPVATLHRQDRAARALYSRYDPAKQAAREAALFDTDAETVLVLGLGLGYHLEQLAHRFPDTRFIVIERRAALARAAMERADFSDLIRNNRLQVHVGGPPEHAAGVAADHAAAAVFRHPALFDADMDYYYPLLRAHRGAGRGPLRVLSFAAPGEALPFSLADSQAAFRALGHEMHVVDLSGVTRDLELLDAVRRAVAGFVPDLVFTIDIVGLCPALMRDMGVPVACWFFDDPTAFLKGDDDREGEHLIPIADVGGNFHIFTWDRAYIEPLEAMGAAHVEYLPFAADPEVFRPVDLTPEQREQFGCDVSFAGNSGPQDLSQYRRTAIQSLCGLDVHVYGDPGWNQLSPCATTRFRGHINNRTELPFLYNASKVNLNLTARQLRTALPIRVFDVAAAAGFLISDYRVDLLELFEDGAEVVCCRDPDDLRGVVEHWLARPDECLAMGRAARERVLKEHTYEHRIRTLLARLDLPDSASSTDSL